VLVFEDVTHRYSQQARLIASRLEAENALAMRNEFLSQMSHEVRSPLTGVLGMAELLGETKMTSEQMDYVKVE
jgi:two-component system sensor histidine kinase/response regulator